MKWVILALVIVAAAGIAGYFFWRYRRNKQHRLISIVALTSEPVSIDPAILARIAGDVLDADLGDGSEGGKDGFVVGAGIIHTIMHDGRMYLVNSFPKPYVDDPEGASEAINDLRIRKSFAEHTSWFSIDAMGVDGTTPEDEIRDWYAKIGKMMAELLDERCLLIFLPDRSLAYPISDETEAALRSGNPVEGLQETLLLPIVPISGDDPEMVAAVKKAKETWPQFVKAFEAEAGENFSVKAPVTYGDNTEFIWISVTSFEGDKIYGKLGNDPGDLGPLKLGSNVSVSLDDLYDWIYIDPNGDMKGGHTINVVTSAAKKKR